MVISGVWGSKELENVGMRCALENWKDFNSSLGWLYVIILYSLIIICYTTNMIITQLCNYLLHNTLYVFFYRDAKCHNF